ncbi:MAG: CoA ester lyase [Pseudomonadota bacterium]
MPKSRSWLFVPGDSERKINKAIASDADKVIIDLEDAVASSNRDVARRLVRELLSQSEIADKRLCIRINPLDSNEAHRDLAALDGALPAAIMLPKIRSDADLVDGDQRIRDLERRNNVTEDSVDVVALVTETPSMTATLPTMQPPPARVRALTWGGEDLSAALGASANKDEDGRWLPIYEYARTQCLLAAKRFGLLAIDTLFSDFRDTVGLEAHAGAALRDGFDGILAIHPAQLEPIHTAYTPDHETLRWAQSVIRAFDASPDAGVVQLNGKMLDQPHLVQAKKILDRSD